MKILLFILMSIVLISCKKKNLVIDVNATNDSVYSNYSQLKVGNYWIYQQFRVDTAGNAMPLNVIDSCYIEKDTIINGKIFYKMYRHNPISSSNFIFLRDSLHYIVDANGDIKFSSIDFSTVFTTKYIISGTDTTYIKEFKMADKDYTVTVPAGTFTTSNFRLSYTILLNWYTGEKVRHQHTRYAKSIGIVVETLQMFVGDPHSVERRLVRYHLN